MKSLFLIIVFVMSSSAQTADELNAQIDSLSLLAKDIASTVHAAYLDSILTADYSDLDALGIEVVSGKTDSIFVNVIVPISIAPDSTIEQYKAKDALQDIFNAIRIKSTSTMGDTLYIRKDKFKRLLPNL